MTDVTSILAANFTEALRQLNTYLTLGLTAGLSALAIEAQSYRQDDLLARWVASGAQGNPPAATDLSKPVKVPFAAVELNAEHATWLLLGATLLGGLLASMATLSALAAADALASDSQVLSAICTYPSLATTSKTVRTVACVSPALFAGAVMWLQGRRLQILLDSKAAGAKYTLLAPFVIVFGALAMQLHRIPC